MGAACVVSCADDNCAKVWEEDGACGALVAVLKKYRKDPFCYAAAERALINLASNKGK